MNTLYPVRVVRPFGAFVVGAIFTPPALDRDYLLAMGRVVRHEPPPSDLPPETKRLRGRPPGKR